MRELCLGPCLEKSTSMLAGLQHVHHDQRFYSTQVHGG